MATNVLVIEDNEQNRYMITFLLEQNGFVVRSAPDGPRGIDMARASTPDVVLLDIQLPGMHGYDVARALREVPELRDLPIVAVTSHAMSGDRERALAAGCTGYIEKPIDPDTFIEEVRSYLSPPPAPSSTRAVP